MNNRMPLLCPRCGHPQQVVHQDDPHHPVRVVHTGTGREACDEPEAVEELPGENPGEAPIDVERTGLSRC
ncbi:hypothetical protein [Kitasatospora phosalacinea]|uniref:Uncharacterized protein n=1 Tax=Kitasatospora phosalacinea TaxID=2065 RepID=A0A9W6PCI6_9ACTN|nr:hypothetical protein [Kitasatospora phosalacinea]GLW52504.1 hypothetical protein Kpho01_05150 [Kitasatospora phosalacinea]